MLSSRWMHGFLILRPFDLPFRLLRVDTRATPVVAPVRSRLMEFLRRDAGAALSSRPRGAARENRTPLRGDRALRESPVDPAPVHA